MIKEDKKRLLDTNICANYLNALRKKEKKRTSEQQRIFENIEKIKSNTKLYISQVTVAELRFGAFRELRLNKIPTKKITQETQATQKALDFDFFCVFCVFCVYFFQSQNEYIIFTPLPKSQSREKNLERIEKFKQAILELKVDDEVWDIFVKMKAELSHLGKPIADMDLLIAATAKRYHLMLISNDKDMNNLDFLIENRVERESWLK